jgi:hypothetical protein
VELVEEGLILGCSVEEVRENGYEDVGRTITEPRYADLKVKPEQ